MKRAEVAVGRPNGKKVRERCKSAFAKYSVVSVPALYQGEESITASLVGRL